MLGIDNDLSKSLLNDAYLNRLFGVDLVKLPSNHSIVVLALLLLLTAGFASLLPPSGNDDLPVEAPPTARFDQSPTWGGIDWNLTADPSATERNASIWGSLIAFEKVVAGFHELWLHDLSNQTSWKVTTSFENHYNPRVWENYVVFQATNPNLQNSSIQLLELGPTDTITRLSPGDLDLAAGNSGGVNRVYLNGGAALKTAASWNSIETDSTWSVA